MNNLSLNSQPSTLNRFSYQDELGSTSHIASGTGALIESYQYDVYGKPRVYNASGVYQPGATPVAQDLFTGQRWHSELGLYGDRNRFMSPDLGRFLQPDPIGFKGDASNLYRYCGNDWANRSDPMGLEYVAAGGLQAGELQNKELTSAERDWAAGSMMWDFEKRADTSGGNGSRDGRAARPDAFSMEVQHSINTGERVAQTGSPTQSKGDQDRIARLGIPTALEKMQGAVEQYNKQFPKYPNGQEIVDAVRGAYENGRIRVGNDSTLFSGKNNPFSTRGRVIYFNPLSHPTSSSIPGLLAHEGYHLIEKTRPHSYASERAAFDAQFGFGFVLRAPGNVPTPDSWIHQQYGY